MESLAEVRAMHRTVLTVSYLRLNRSGPSAISDVYSRAVIYKIEDLAAFVASLPGWYDSSGEKSAKVVVKG